MNPVQCRINSTNVNHLQLSWHYPTHSLVRGKPLVAYNRVYAYDSIGYIYFVDLHTGSEIYKRQLYTPAVSSKPFNKLAGFRSFSNQYSPCSHNGFTSSGCLSDGYLYLASTGTAPDKFLKNSTSGEFFIIDAIGGNIVFRENLSLSPYSGSFSDLFANKNYIYVGVSSCEHTVELVSKRLGKAYQPTSIGQVIAYDKALGKRKWTQHTIGLLPYDPIYAKGAPVSSGFALDARYHLLYFGTGHNYGTLKSKSACSLVSLDSITGEFKWQYQTDSDTTFNTTPNLFYCKYKNTLVPAIGMGNQNGYYYVFHRLTGHLLWQTNCNINSESNLDLHMIASYKNNHIYIWIGNKTPSNTITFCCLSAHTGEIIWSHIIKGSSLTSTASIVNDLYFISTYEGYINAYTLTNGHLVWTGKIPGTSISSSLTFTSNSLLLGTGATSFYTSHSSICGIYCFKLT